MGEFDSDLIDMSADANKNLAGPLSFERSVIERDAAIREDNDAERIDDKAVLEYVNNNKEKIFSLQATFFAELRQKVDE